MPQYAVFLNFPADQIQADPDPESLAAHAAHGEELAQSGAMVYGSPLADHSATTSIRGGVITDGPYTEAKDVVVGFYVLDVANLDEALRLARKNPINVQGGGVEVRPLEANDGRAGCDSA